MANQPPPPPNSGSYRPKIKELANSLVGAQDPQIMRIVALVDAMMRRGAADQLIEPLRQRLARLRPPRPLRFDRLMFQPLDLLIVPAARYRQGQRSIPRSALIPMAEHVRLAMGTAATDIATEVTGRTTADTDLISRLGESLWPAAARILANGTIPETWDSTDLSPAVYRSLADIVATLLAEATTLDGLCADAATGLLPPPPETVALILTRVARTNETALPMVIAMLLDRLPESIALLPPLHAGPEAAAIHAAMEEAADLLLRQLDQDEGAEKRIAAGSLADAGAATRRIAALLQHLDAANAKPRRREQLRIMRQRLGASCQARFASGLQDELLAPLQHLGVAPDPAAIPALESSARGLRVLETEGRLVGSGSNYDLLLRKAAEAIQGVAMRDRLGSADQFRLVEILCGPDAAMEMLDRQH